MLSEDLKEFTDSIGAIAEMALLYYKASINAGASRQEADDLTRVFLEATLKQSRDAGQDNG